jgi:uncharacterized glyoxalase superfamily protein PhnB
MSETKLACGVPVIPGGADVGATIDFYVQKLGFTEKFTHGSPIDYAGVARDGVLVHLYKNDDKQLAENTMFRVIVENVDALYAEYEPQGVIHPNGKLSTKPWGTRDFAVLDPTGICITFQSV